MIRTAAKKMSKVLSFLTMEGTGKATRSPGSAPMTSLPADADMPVSHSRDTAWGNLGRTKSNYRSLGAVDKAMRAPVVFSSILLVRTRQ